MKRILAGAFIGTSVMTVASYMYSELRNKNFREPQLLTIYLNRLVPEQSYQIVVTEAWLIHYTIGILFVMVYAKLWNKRNAIEPNAKNGFMMGAVTGIAAVVGWHMALLLHPKPPELDMPEFYSQLIPAHGVFGIFAALAYARTHSKKTV